MTLIRTGKMNGKRSALKGDYSTRMQHISDQTKYRVCIAGWAVILYYGCPNATYQSELSYKERNN